jgi:hypothetical protein
MRIVMLLHKSVEHDSRVRREAAALAGAGHEVCVVEFVELRDSPRSLDGFSRTSASPPAWMRRRLPRPIYRAAFLVWFVRRGLRLSPDVVHAHDAAMLLPGLLVTRCTGALLVYDSHELATSVPYRERFWAWFVAVVERVAVPRRRGRHGLRWDRGAAARALSAGRTAHGAAQRLCAGERRSGLTGRAAHEPGTG